ncbi:MAG TPA: glycosyltransferase [Bryobacteraceae bacterium]|nr:glycosyltransferase [Bryobacteraceae bacterium]
MIRVLAFLEATYVSGPAKNVLEFARCAAGFEENARVQTEIAAFQTSPGDDELTDAVSRAGLPLHRIEQASLPTPSTVERVRRAIAASQPDIVQTHSIKSHFLLRASGAWKQYPWVAFHHGYTLTVLRLRAYNEFDRWSLRRAARVITVSRAFAGQLARKGVPGNRITVLHNAIDPDWGRRASDADLRAATRTRLGVEAGEHLALMVGRLSKEKRQVLLIQALGRLKAQSPEVRMRILIVGEGPERASILQTAASLGLSNNLVLAGHQSDVAPYYAAADLAVISSDTEGSPNALLEAMAAGKPVVATAVGGIPEIVTHEDTALLVPAGDAGKLADAIARTLFDFEGARQMAERAHALILSHYSPQQRARFLARFYADMLSGRHQ